MCVYSGYVSAPLANIRGIRSVLEDDIPISIFFAGSEDLAATDRALLQSIPGVSTRDVTQVSNNYATHAATCSKPGNAPQILQLEADVLLRKFVIKAFAIVASGFAEVIFMDSDLTMLVPPSSLFQMPGYR